MSFTYPIRGEFWPQDEFGRVLNIAVKKDKLSTLWAEICDTAIDFALERFADDLHSVYLSGPAARNRPGGGSIVIVLKKGVEDINAASWQKSSAQELRRSHNSKFGLNVHVIKWREVFATMGRYSPAKFRLSVNSVCVAGRNVTRLITPHKIDEAIANSMLVNFETRLIKAKQRTLASDSRTAIRSVSANVGHAIVSAGYATVLAAEQTFTEDLDIRRDVFALHHPERSEDIQRAYDMSALPSCDPVQVRAFINEASDWMLPLVDKWLNTHNPRRVDMLSA